MDTYRREFVVASGTAIAGAFAGCSSENESGGDTPTEDAAEGGNAGETSSGETATPSPTPVRPQLSTDWSQAGYDPGDTDVSPEASPLTGELKQSWSAQQLDYDPLGPPIVYDGNVFTKAWRDTNTPSVVCLSGGTGELLWNRDFSELPTAPQVTGDCLVMYKDGSIVGITPENDKAFVHAVDHTPGGLTAANGLVFFTLEYTSRSLHAVDVETGEEAWSVPSIGDGRPLELGIQPIVRDGVVFVSAEVDSGDYVSEPALIGYDVSDGTTVVEIPERDVNRVATANRLYRMYQPGGGDNARIGAYTFEGTEEWSIALDDSSMSVRGMAADDRALYLTRSNAIEAYSADDGSELWRSTLVNTPEYRAAIGGGVAYVVSAHGLQRFDLETGEEIGSTVSEFPAAKPVVAGEHLVVADRDRSVSVWSSAEATGTQD